MVTEAIAQGRTHALTQLLDSVQHLISLDNFLDSKRGGNTKAVPLMSMAVLNSTLRAISNGVGDGICGYDST